MSMAGFNVVTFSYTTVDYGLYDQYLAEWEEQMKNGVGFPLHIVYYEDLKDVGI